MSIPDINPHQVVGSGAGPPDVRHRSRSSRSARAGTLSSVDVSNPRSPDRQSRAVRMSRETFDPNNPPLIGLNLVDELDQASVIGRDSANTRTSSRGQELENRTPERPHRRQRQQPNTEAAVSKIQEALDFLPPDKQDNITEMIRKLVGEFTSVGTGADDRDFEEDSEIQDSTSGTFTEAWTSLVSWYRILVLLYLKSNYLQSRGGEQVLCWIGLSRNTPVYRSPV